MAPLLRGRASCVLDTGGPGTSPRYDDAFSGISAVEGGPRRCSITIAGSIAE
jgi:hypothetical protein